MSTAPAGRTVLAHVRRGSGEPVVLLHGIGGDRGVWDRVIPMLAGHHDVLAVDLPGFGDSPTLAPGDEPSPRRLAAAVAATLDELRIERPHLVGNSLGGWIALELAQRRPVASVTLLSPAGLWRRRTPAYCRVSLLGTWWACRRGAGVLHALSRWPWSRRLVFWQILGHPELATPGGAQGLVTAMGTGGGFRSTLAATLPIRFVRHGEIDAPVTLAFGTRDRILLPWQSRFTHELPPQTIAAELRGAGHVPMPDAPDAVAAVVLATTARAVRSS
ncbi:alpha/beta hydrolase fold protein [Beutenbergia cavernae DSM 12333]|uniref:Alpha/beta hydrolase fold protein n=1 Tax=Beutenbergia cavernae (strain ATCC BAA-8 / DSM 12333 / CCUG 43141 / JCM 11478 / NBRC 16432 / NCIMB 13614 / HKI 0122) TaxID=471853 RepID=C5BZT8_BEUC1|nr:alpha/beta fold hydrolase [Beutenbergia cavernae]ACQ81268.1 alpha/beta hydrolase fold protein [Beutenbergia cavernae DSM 12333]